MNTPTFDEINRAMIKKAHEQAQAEQKKAEDAKKPARKTKAV